MRTQTLRRTSALAAALVAALLSVALMSSTALAEPTADAVQAPASGAGATADVTEAAEAPEATTYTVRLYAGNRGLINDGAFCEWTGVPYGADLELTGARVAVTDPKYYVKGIRLAGLDNVKNVSYVGQVDDRNFVAGTVRVTQDADYVLAYGIMANRVAYTVRYVDANGFTVAQPETFYGDIGDTPALAAVYVEGYLPDAYEITKTLVADADENVITFTYTRLPEEYVTEPTEEGTVAVTTPSGETVVAQQPTGTDEGAGAAGGAADADDGAGDAPATPTPLVTATGEELIDDDGTPLVAPLDTMSIDDEAVPMASGGFGEGAEAAEDRGLRLAFDPVSVACLAGAALLLVLALVLWRRGKRADAE